MYVWTFHADFFGILHSNILGWTFSLTYVSTSSIVFPCLRLSLHLWYSIGEVCLCKITFLNFSFTEFLESVLSLLLLFPCSVLGYCNCILYLCDCIFLYFFMFINVFFKGLYMFEYISLYFFKNLFKSSLKTPIIFTRLDLRFSCASVC